MQRVLPDAARRLFLLGLIALMMGAGAFAFAQQGEEEEAPAESAEQAAEQSGPLASLPIERRTLGNGLRVVLSPDRTIPTVGIAVYYDVGSRNEVRGRSGFAHLFEHMMFQGSQNVAKGEHFSLVMNRGGSMNGTTNHDRTNYFETLPSNELALGLWLEADRMRSLAVTESNFENQRQVVMEEWRQSYRNQPYAMSSLEINRLAYGTYWPYAHSTIGEIEDLQNAPLSAVQEFFHTYYRPNNAVLSISGDFDVDEAMQMVERYFGDIAPRPVPEFNPLPFRAQTATREESMDDPLAERAAFHIAYHIPPMRQGDHYALEVLGLVLGDGESSRLYQELVKEEELCQQIFVGTDDRRGPDLFSVWAVMAEGHTGAEARERVYAQIRSVEQNGVTERELEKARNRLRSIFVFALQSNLQRSQRLAEYELYWGDAALIRGELANYLAVTDADLRRVAGQYFAPENRTVLDVLPASTEAGQ